MTNYNLSFIDDQKLFDHVKATVLSYRFNINLESFNKNLIDPIKLTFDSAVYRHGMEKTIENEVLRQLDKSNTNNIGYFHQNIFNHIGEGWSVPNKGYDIVNKSRLIYVEMKNKHNTMNSSSSQKTYMRMQNTLLENPKAQCLLVEVIAAKSQDKIWEISVDNQKCKNAGIRRVSIDKFYHIVTGDQFAFRDLCNVLPAVMKDVLKYLEDREINNSVFQELKLLSPNLLKSIFLMSFSEYEGFSQFDPITIEL